MTKELVVNVKLKLASDNMNPVPGIANMPGSPLLAGGHTPGSVGGANSTGSNNPLAAQTQKAAEQLKTFDSHLAKATESLNHLRESSKGMLGALKNALFSSGGNFSPGHAQSLMSGAGQFIGKYAAPAAVGGGALLAAKYIWDSTNAAASRFQAAGGDANLGHKTRLHDAQGNSIMNKIGLGEGLRVKGTGSDWVDAGLNLIGVDEMLGLSGPIGTGGGKVNSRGDIVTQQHQMNMVQKQFAESMRRTAADAPAANIYASAYAKRNDLYLQRESFADQYRGYRDYAWNTDRAKAEYMDGMNPLLKDSRSSLEKIHGKGIGSLIAAQETFGATVSSQGYGAQVAEAKAAQRTNRRVTFDVKSLLEDEESHLKTLKANQKPVDKDMVPEDQLRTLERIAQLKERIKSLGEQDLQLQDRIKTLTQDQLRAQKDVVTQKLSAVMGARLQEAQTLQGQKEAFGMMDEGDQMYHKDIAERFKAGGIKAITAEERGILQNSPLGEDVRIAARDRADAGGFADMYRGSRAEARANEYSDQQKKLEAMQVAITKTININVESDKAEIGKAAAEAMGKYVSDIMVTVRQSAELQLKQADNAARLSGMQKGEANP